MTNLHTKWIADHLGISSDIALRVQKQINKNYNLDWSEANFKEIYFVAEQAFSDLNIHI